MKNHFAKAFLCIISCSFALSVKVPALAVSPSENGALHVEGTLLLDEKNQPIQLKGLSTHGLAWFPQYVNEDCFAQLKNDWNVNVIRLAMYTAESGGYCTDGDQEALKKLIDDGISYASSQDLYVVIDWHILSDQDPNLYKEEAISFFKEMAEKYADHNNILYEICNEPNGQTTWADIKQYAEEVIPVIRSSDPDAVILVGTPNWSQDVDLAAEDPITDYDNLMYSLHFYSATHKDDLRSKMKTALDKGLPVFVSEYGICDASGNGQLDTAQADLWIDELNKNQISYINWSLSNKDEAASFFKSSCDKISGFSPADLSPSGQWVTQMLTGALPKPTPSEEINPETSSSGFNVSIKNSWQTNGEYFFQYDATFTNASSEPLSSWNVDLTFDQEFTLSDSWNGSYHTNGNTLSISSLDYNSNVPAGKTVSDIGFIISCKSPSISYTID